MNKVTYSILSHVAAILIFVPIVLPLLFIIAVLASVFFCAVVYERLYTGIKYCLFDACHTCDFCKTNYIDNEVKEKPIDTEAYKWYGRNTVDKDENNA